MLKINYIGHGNDDMPQDEQVELLCVKLKEYALDSMFEAYGDFCSKLEASVLEACGYGLRPFPEPQIYRFHGNFAELSFVFSLDTDDDALIERLIGLKLCYLRLNFPDYDPSDDEPDLKQKSPESRAAHRTLFALREEGDE